MLGGLIFVLIGVGGYITSRQSLTAAAWVSHTQEVIASIDEIQAGLLSAESSARGFVLTDNEAFLGVHADAIGRLPGRIARLEVLVQDNPLQLRNVAALDKLVDMRLVQINDLLHSYRATGLDGARASIAKGVFQTSSALRRQVQLMGELERRQLVSRTQANHDSARWVLWMTAIGILSGLLVMVLAYRLLSRELARRVRAEEEASTSSTRLAESFNTLERTSAGLKRWRAIRACCRTAATPKKPWKSRRARSPRWCPVCRARCICCAPRAIAPSRWRRGERWPMANAGALRPKSAGHCDATALTWWRTPAWAWSASMPASIFRRMRARSASRCRRRERSWACSRCAATTRRNWPR